MATEILTPPGRFVVGNLYQPNDKDAEGKPLVVKSGPNAGQPRVEYLVGIAIPKGTEQHWSQTTWGAAIWKEGHTAFPQQAQAPTFAWKVKDGDSTIPNRRGRKPCENEGWPGHWVLFFSGGYQPKIYDAKGTTLLAEPGVVKPGHYIQVFGSVASNNSQQQAGVYLNHGAVAHAGFGKEIEQGRDYSQVGFGQAALPAGASATPLAQMVAPVPPAAAAALPPPPPVAVVPNPAILGGAPLPPPPPAAPPAPVRQMTAKAAGTTYEQFIGSGWTDETLIAHGYMVA